MANRIRRSARPGGLSIRALGISAIGLIDAEIHAEVSQALGRRDFPLALKALARVIREMPRDPEVIEMLKKFAGVDPLPSR